MADPEGPLPGGVTKSARSAARGGCGMGNPLLQGGGGGPGGIPGIFFLKNGCKWCIMSPYFAEYVLIFPTKLCVILRDISTLAVEDNIKPKRGVFDPLTLWLGGGGSGSPREII